MYWVGQKVGSSFSMANKFIQVFPRDVTNIRYYEHNMLAKQTSWPTHYYLILSFGSHFVLIRPTSSLELLVKGFHGLILCRLDLSISPSSNIYC